MGIHRFEKTINKKTKVKKMHRFFISGSEAPYEIGDCIVIGGEDHDHLSKSLRMKTGESLVVCDRHQIEYVVVIRSVEKKQTVTQVIEKRKNDSEPAISVVLYQAVAKGSKMEWIIQKSVELGVDRIVPVITKRCVASPKDGEKKRQRWQKIAVEGAKQSQRGKVPQIEQPRDLEAVIGDDSFTVPNGVAAYEMEKSAGIKQWLKKRETEREFSVFIGPEGGFEKEEIEAMYQKKGIEAVGLGNRILRTETAGIAVLAMIMYEYEMN
ncbi:MAG TPA: 16S rRNA methyltransferase [Eubacteriaceae bacterium]|nr:16S rRNA methyltransferase [Eubacteriaceae bacterium]